MIHSVEHHLTIIVCAFFVSVVLSSDLEPKKNRSVSSTYIIAEKTRVCKEIAVIMVALIGSVASIERRMMLTANHIGPAAALPCPPPYRGLFVLPV